MKRRNFIALLIAAIFGPKKIAYTEPIICDIWARIDREGFQKSINTMPYNREDWYKQNGYIEFRRGVYPVL